jgi:hypothetical protein
MVKEQTLTTPYFYSRTYKIGRKGLTAYIPKKVILELKLSPGDQIMISIQKKVKQ